MLRKVSFGLGVTLACACVWAEPGRLGDGPAAGRSSFNPNAPTTERADDRSARDSDGSGSSSKGQQRVMSPYWQNSADGDFPAADIRAVPPARAMAVQARWVHSQLQSDLNIQTTLLSKELESTDEFRQALNAESSAYDKLLSAHRNALSGLQLNETYQAGIELRDQLTQQIRELHYDPKPDEDRITAMAWLKLSYVADNRKLETDALERDGSYQEARKAYIAAAQKVNELREANARQVSKDENLIALRRAVAETRIAKLVSGAYLNSTVRARNIAVDYSAYDRSVDRYRPVVGGYGWYDLGSYYPQSAYYR